jgi:hypothetical protein
MAGKRWLSIFFMGSKTPRGKSPIRQSRYGDRSKGYSGMFG